MFCPKCGKSEQQINTFCRNCGTFLPDFDKFKSQENTPEAHFAANSTLSVMTAIVSLVFAIALHVTFTGKDGTPIVIYLTIGFLTAIFFWQAQVFWRTRQLKKQFPGLSRNKKNRSIEKTPLSESINTRELLNEADLSGVIPPSVVGVNTNKLIEKSPHKSSWAFPKAII